MALPQIHPGLSHASRLRVLYVLPAEHFGGAERQGVLHMAGLPGCGVDVVPVVGPGERIREELGAAGVEDYVFLQRMCTESHLKLGTFGQMKWAAQFVRDWSSTQRALTAIAIGARVDLIVANRSWAWVSATRVARQLGLPIVWRGGSRLTSSTETVALSALSHLYPPDLVLANCEAVRDDLAPRVPCETRILHNGVDVRRFDPARVAPTVRRQLGIADEVPVVGFLARPAPEKGMEMFARVATETAERCPEVQFLMAGDFGWREHYEKHFRAAGLGERVRFLGHVQDVPGFLKSCDAVLLTSKSHSIEGLPNALLEAMAMGRPIVATRVGGVAEAIEDGVEGFLAGESEATEMANHLARLIADPLLRARVGAAGRARVLAQFREEKVVAELASVLRSVHARAGLPRLQSGHRHDAQAHAF